jgi:hypothetical protein
MFVIDFIVWCLRFPPRLNRILPSSGLLRGVNLFKADVSGLPTCPVFKGYAVLTLENGTDR